MIEQKLPTDPFRKIVEDVIMHAEYQGFMAKKEIIAMAETHRRSVGQRNRRFMESLK